MANSEAIMIGGHPLAGTLQGANYKVTRLAGWYERPAVKRAAISRERADGDFPTTWNFEARYISIDGWVTAKNHEQMHHIIDQLNGLCATQREWLTVQGHGQTQSALVEADGTPYVYPETDRMLRFELRFKANDPRKTGALYTNVISDTPTTHSQLGNYPATPTIRVSTSNAVGGFGLVAEYGGRRYRWEYATSAWSNQDHVIDLASGKHLVNGTEEPDRLARADLWGIPPRTPVTVTLESLGSANRLSGELIFRDTWI